MSDGFLLMLDRRELTLTLDSGALRVSDPHGGFERYPLELLESLVIYGNPLADCALWRALAERGIPAVLLPARGTGAGAWLGAGLTPALRLRRAQHGLTLKQRLTLARGLLAHKLDAQRALLMALADLAPPQAQATAALVAGRLAQARADLTLAGDTDGLMGLEGSAAAAWYGWLQTYLPAQWQFQGRNRRPPRDPVNALLSLGYTLLGAEVRAAVTAAGLDPALGLLHQPYPGREALVLDALEPLRPGVDALVLDLVADGLAPDQFHTGPSEGCRLTPDGRARFYPAWARARRDWPAPGETLPDSTDPGLRAACRRVVQGLAERMVAPEVAGP